MDSVVKLEFTKSNKVELVIKELHRITFIQKIEKNNKIKKLLKNFNLKAILSGGKCL